MDLSQDYKDSSNEISKRLKHLFEFHFLCPSGGLKSRLQGQLLVGLSQDYKDSSNEINKRLKHLFEFHFLCPSGGLKSRLQGQQ